MRVLFFGASTAQGYWDARGGWVDRLKQHYDGLQLADWSKEQPRVMNLGISDDTAALLLKRMENEARARFNPKGIAIVISIGTNNAAIREGKEHTPEDYADELEEVLAIARSLTSKVLFVGFQGVDETKTNPLPWIDIRFKNARIKLFEDTAKEVCEGADIPFVPVIDRFNKQVAKGVNMHSHDGLHPGENGHKLIFDLVLPELDKLLIS
jgi:lysophospholipase L1-like esterase